MISDIVVDTNVFLHADNAVERRRDEAQAFVLALRESDAKLCVDEGFSVSEAENRSHIGSEYLKNLRHGMLGFAIVAHLASSARMKLVPRSVTPAIGRRIRRHVRSSRDRVFVKVASNSEEKILASHDFADIPQADRDQLRATIVVLVLSAEEALEHFA